MVCVAIRAFHLADDGEAADVWKQVQALLPQEVLGIFNIKRELCRFVDVERDGVDENKQKRLRSSVGLVWSQSYKRVQMWMSTSVGRFMRVGGAMLCSTFWVW